MELGADVELPFPGWLLQLEDGVDVGDRVIGTRATVFLEGLEDLPVASLALALHDHELDVGN